MPTARLRKRLLDRLVQSVNTAGELGLALLMTAGVAHCGGSTQTALEDGSADGAADHQLAIEAAQEGGTVIVEAPIPVPDAGPTPDASVIIVEAPPPAPDAGYPGWDAQPVVEAPPPPNLDAGSDASDAGRDAYIFVEAPF
jgi:hypothetical protein